MAADDLTALTVKYRPAAFDDVVGQSSVVKSVRQVLAKGRSKAYLFHGPAGTGKTTLARLVAKEVGCNRQNLTEVNAADVSGVDDMRRLVEGTLYSGTGGSRTKVVILDECQRLSAAAWSVLLKPVEEPSPHLYWCFCTTELAKVPQAHRTRCAAYELHAVRTDDLFALLDGVKNEEGLKTPDDVVELCCQKAQGSPRQALANLAIAAECRTRKEAARLLRHSTEGGNAGDLCRLLVRGRPSWQQAMEAVARLKGEEPETVRQIVCAWFCKIAIGAKGDRQAQHACAVLDAFGTPYPYPCSTPTPIVLSLAKLLL